MVENDRSIQSQGFKRTDLSPDRLIEQSIRNLEEKRRPAFKQTARDAEIGWRQLDSPRGGRRDGKARAEGRVRGSAFLSKKKLHDA